MFELSIFLDITASGNAIQQMTFAEVLHHSLTGQSTMQTWCNECDRYQQHVRWLFLLTPCSVKVVATQLNILNTISLHIQKEIRSNNNLCSSYEFIFFNIFDPFNK